MLSTTSSTPISLIVIFVNDGAFQSICHGVYSTIFTCVNSWIIYFVHIMFRDIFLIAGIHPVKSVTHLIVVLLQTVEVVLQDTVPCARARSRGAH